MPPRLEFRAGVFCDEWLTCEVNIPRIARDVKYKIHFFLDIARFL